MDLGIKGKVAVVSGGSKGIGLATARELATEGANLALCARGFDDLEKRAEEIRQEFVVDVLTVCADVTDPEQVLAFRDAVRDHYSHVDILVNNAGRAYPGRFGSLIDENFFDDYSVKVMSHVRMIRAFLPLVNGREGRIININSIHGHKPDPRFFTSSVNRAASIAFSRAVALELAKENILVNSVNIGYALTPQWDNVHKRSRPEMDREAFFELMGEEDVPIGRMGRPEEVAATVTFLASSRASFITGASIDVGGGMG